MLYSDITELIGNTPLLRLDPGKHGIDGAEVYAKLEFCNPFGSVKDRIAWGMIRDDLPGITRRGQTLVEASSGNTAKALQVLAAMHGIRLRVLTNRTRSRRYGTPWNCWEASWRSCLACRNARIPPCRTTCSARSRS